MSVRLGRRTARRVSIGLLGACGAALAVAFAVPAAREADLSATRTTTYRLPKRKLAPFARRFESTLPILEIVIAEESLPNPEDEPIPALMRVFDREGVNRPGAMPSALLPFARVRHRGASSMHSHYRQHSIRLEIRDEKQKPSRFDLCGLTPDDDFALIASGMDRSLIRDWMAYALAAPLIPFTPRGRFVEVFVRNARARLDEQTYQGVYLAMEQIEAGPHRVDIGPLEVASTREGLEGGAGCCRATGCRRTGPASRSGMNRSRSWGRGGGNSRRRGSNTSGRISGVSTRRCGGGKEARGVWSCWTWIRS